jgi:hypothetical protein
MGSTSSNLDTRRARPRPGTVEAPVIGSSCMRVADRYRENSKIFFTETVAAVGNSGAWCQTQCGDHIEFLAYSGCRIDESRHVNGLTSKLMGLDTWRQNRDEES